MQNPYNIPKSVRRILVIGDGMSLAHVARAMVFAKRLRELGYEIDFATSSHANYFDFAKQEKLDPHEVFCVKPQVALSKIRRGSHIFDRKTLRTYVESDLQLIKTCKPDMIISDMRMSLNISAQLACIRYHNITNAYMTHYCAIEEKPPRSFPMTRVLRGPLSSLYPSIKKATLRYYAANFRWMRKREGLPDTVEDVFDVITSPHHNYLADTPQFMPSRSDLPSQFQYIGPLVWEPTVDMQAYPAWWPEAQLRRDLTYVTMGSTGSDRKMRAILRHLYHAGRQAVVTLGNRQIRETYGAWTSKFLPGSAILPHCDLMICHGGSGTIYQGLMHRVPILCLPTFHDQEINAGQVESLGHGRVIYQARDVRRYLCEMHTQATEPHGNDSIAA